MARAIRDGFLDRAACFAVTSSPSTSAFLVAERLDASAASHLAISPAFRTTCCLSCGCLFPPGWTASVTRESRASDLQFRERGGKLSHQAWHKEVIRECRSCHHKTVITVRKPVKLKQRGKVKFIKDAAVTLPSEGPSSAKLTAKQRAKDRKSKEGLQALMSSRSKQKTAASTPSFDLMDFMKA